MIQVLLLIAAEPSPISIGNHLVVGYSLIQESGGLPTFASEQTFDRYTTWMHVRGGVVDSQPNTQLGTELGFEFELRLGFTPNEAENIYKSLPVGFDASAGIAMRAFTFNEPFLGMIVPHLQLEFGAGGGHWWSDTPRFAVIGGARVAVGNAGGISLEADYTLVPFVITGAPGALKTQHLEHRIAVSLGADQVGLSVWLRFSRQRWRLPEDDEWSSTTGRALGVGVEWRP